MKQVGESSIYNPNLSKSKLATGSPDSEGVLLEILHINRILYEKIDIRMAHINIYIYIY